jgi:hypothetical protein
LRCATRSCNPDSDLAEAVFVNFGSAVDIFVQRLALIDFGPSGGRPARDVGRRGEKVEARSDGRKLGDDAVELTAAITRKVRQENGGRFPVSRVGIVTYAI